MRWIFMNCLLLASLAVALPNGRNKRDFTFLKNLVKNILYGKHEINLDFNPSTEEEPRETSKFKLFEVPGYDGVLIKVPVDGESNPEEIPVDLNAFGSTVGTKTSGNTFDALKDVNNLVSSGILNENYDKFLKGSLGPMFPNSSGETESNENEINNGSVTQMSDPVYTEGNEPFEKNEDFQEPAKLINPYKQPQNAELPMMYSDQSDPETIEANSDLPNCDQLRVDDGVLVPADQYQFERAPEIYPAPSFVNVFYPNIPADQNIQNPLYPPRTTERNHHNHHKYPGHHHYRHHHSHHRRPHHHYHHVRPHHHLHTKLNETSPTGNGNITNDEIQGSTPSSLKPEVSTTENPLNYRVQFVSRLTNTETFQGMNMGQTVQDTNRSNYTSEKDNATNPVGASYGSNQFVYRNQDNLKMVTFEDHLKSNHTKAPSNNDDYSITKSKDQESGVKQNTLSNVTADPNIENSLTSTEKIRIEDRLTPERSRKIHVHHHSARHQAPERHHHHHHRHHRHHHAINPYPLYFHIPENFGLNENPEYKRNENGKVPTGMASEDNKPDKVPLQRFGDELKTNVKTNNETDVNAPDNYIPPVSDNTDFKKELGVKGNTFPSETAVQNDSLHNPMSTDKGETGNQDALSPERIKHNHVNHRSRHPSRQHRHHHRRGHHHHVIGWRHQHKYVQLPSIFDSDAFKSIMNANNLHTNKVTENPETTGESATEINNNKLKENEWKSNEETQIADKLNGNSADNQNNTGSEPIRWKGSDSGVSKSKNRGDIPDDIPDE